MIGVLFFNHTPLSILLFGLFRSVLWWFVMSYDVLRCIYLCVVGFISSLLVQ